MTHSAFVDKYNWRYIDADGFFGNQCVDLMRAYVKEVHGLAPYTAIPTTGNAKDIFNNFKENQYFKKILNSPTNSPLKGDILFFKTSTWFPFLFGWAGHVGVVESANLYDIILFNQNYPTNSPCVFTKFKYKDCLGWLHRK